MCNVKVLSLPPPDLGPMLRNPEKTQVNTLRGTVHKDENMITIVTPMRLEQRVGVVTTLIGRTYVNAPLRTFA